VSTDRLRAFRGCFDIVKVDWLATPAAEITPIVSEGKRVGAALLAEKLETETELKKALAAGFSLFQGYAIGLPLNLQRRDVISFSSHTVQLLKVVNSDGFDFAEAEAVVRTDPALTFKILAFANSSLAAQSRRINSLRHALVLFGERNLRHAALLVFLAQTSGAAPSFALVEALVAGLFSESLAREARRPDMANVCMLAATLSHLDRLLDVPMSELLQRLPVDAILQEALINRSGLVGAYVQLTRVFQDGDWAKTDALVRELGLSSDSLQPLYRRAVLSANELIRGDASASARLAA
jgi:c-di-GMP-related signal transduction protein